MKKFGLWMVLATLLSVSGYAAEQAEAPPAPNPKKAAAEEQRRAEQRKKIDAKKAEINGSEWQVNLTPSDPKGKPEADVLTFQNGQVRSKVLSDRGFQPTNYTISMEEGNEMTVWETMQTSPKEGVVFIRGEWKDDQMRGIYSQQMEGGKTKDYSFTTAAKAAVPPTTPKKPETPAAPTEEVSTPETEKAPETPNEEPVKPAKKKKFGL